MGLKPMLMGSKRWFLIVPQAAVLWVCATAQAEQFPDVLELGDLNGINGVRLHDNNSRTSACPGGAAGDVDGDGVDDLAIAATFASLSERPYAGSSYVVFGKRRTFSGVEALAEISELRLDGGAAEDFAHAISSAGDINGDGFSDLVIGAQGADPNGMNQAGSSYVVFGSPTAFASPTALDSIQMPQGFRIDGPSVDSESGARVGQLGDVNGDGLGDLFVSAHGAGSDGGHSFVVFGSASGYPSTLALADLDGDVGFRIEGASIFAAGAGDVNDDGLDDIILGNPVADPNGVSNAGSVYVIYGTQAGFENPLVLSNLDQSQGYRIDGGSQDDYFGGSVGGAGDVNDDGIDDIVVGARGADPGGVSGAGSSYVIFGRRDVIGAPVPSELLNGFNGFRMNGLAEEALGGSVSGLGDVNNDGLDDFILGADRASSSDQFSGRSYVLFGRSGGFGAVFDLAGLDGATGFRIEGRGFYDFAGSCVNRAGDINGDGVNDIYIGSIRNHDPFGIGIGGDGYIVFGINSEQIFADGFN